MGDLYGLIRKVGAVLIVLILIVMMGLLFTKEPIDEITNTLRGGDVAAKFDGEKIYFRDRAYFDEGCREWLKDRIDYEDKNGLLDEQGQVIDTSPYKENPQFLKERNNYLMDQCLNSRVQQTYSLAKIGRMIGFEEGYDNIKRELWEAALESSKDQSRLVQEDRLAPEEIYRYNLSSIPLKIRALQKEAQSSYNVLANYMPEIESKQKWIEATSKTTLNMRIVYYNDSLLYNQIKDNIQVSDAEVIEFYRSQKKTTSATEKEGTPSVSEKKRIIDYLKGNKAQQEVSVVKSRLGRSDASSISKTTNSLLSSNNIPISSQNPGTKLSLKTSLSASSISSIPTTPSKNSLSDKSRMMTNRGKKQTLDDIAKLTGLKIYNLNGVKLSQLNSVRVANINLNLMQKDFLNNINKSSTNKLIGPFQSGPHMVFVEITKLNLISAKLKEEVKSTQKVSYKMKNDKELSSAFIEYLIQAEVKRSKYQAYKLVQAPQISESAQAQKEGEDPKKVRIISPQEMAQLQKRQEDLESQLKERKILASQKKQIQAEFEKNKSLLDKQESLLLKISPDDRNQYQTQLRQALTQLQAGQVQIMAPQQLAFLKSQQVKLETRLKQSSLPSSEKEKIKAEFTQNKRAIDETEVSLKKISPSQRAQYDLELQTAMKNPQKGITALTATPEQVINLQKELRQLEAQQKDAKLTSQKKSELQIQVDRYKQFFKEYERIKKLTPQERSQLEAKNKVSEGQGSGNAVNNSSRLSQESPGGSQNSIGKPKSLTAPNIVKLKGGQ